MAYKDPQLLMIEEVAKLLNVNVSIDSRMNNIGELPKPIVLAGKQTRWIKEDITRLVNILAKERRWDFATPSPVEPWNGSIPIGLQSVASGLVASASVPCVYFLVKGDRVVYVGSSINPKKRVEQHRTGCGAAVKKEFDSAVFLPVPLEEMLETERTFIAMLNPPLNGSMRRPELAIPAVRKAFRNNDGYVVGGQSS